MASLVGFKSFHVDTFGAILLFHQGVGADCKYICKLYSVLYIEFCEGSSPSRFRWWELSAQRYYQEGMIRLLWLQISYQDIYMFSGRCTQARTSRSQLQISPLYCAAGVAAGRGPDCGSKLSRREAAIGGRTLLAAGKHGPPERAAVYSRGWDTRE